MEENDSDDEPAGFGTNAEVLRNAATCLLPENREAEMIINDTGKTIHNVVKIAPGEGKIPQNYLREEHFDVKAFPRHHPTGNYGLDHPRDRKIPAQKFFCQRLLNRDPRFANDMSYLFMAQQRVERAALESQLRLAGRKGKIQGNNGPNKKIHLDDIYNVFQNIRGSPKYWQKAKNELIAKVKYLGPFHIFFTLSCGETRWFDVFASILKDKGITVEFGDNWDGNDENIKVEGKSLWEYIEEELQESKHELLKECIVLVTQHFENRVKEFIKHILMGQGKDKVKIKHYVFRIEFQARGMPHIHGVAWIDEECLKKH